jgi:putative SbcD/Mre11-related phosphoesterase
VADLHLGYTWAHRAAGQLMPVSPPDETLERLLALQAEYQPRRIVLLGDIVHRALPLRPLENEVRSLVEALANKTELVLVAGNHDRKLATMLERWRLPVALVKSCLAGPYVCVHGDEALAEPNGARVIMGHEHPAVVLHDGVTTYQKCPCFLVGEGTIILPAFSAWAAGVEVRERRFLSPIARCERFRLAIAVCGERLLPVHL